MASVRVPILPTNMEAMIMALPAGVKEAVMPVESPTVPKAENSSNSSFIKSTPGSVILRKKVEIKMMEMEKRAME